MLVLTRKAKQQIQIGPNITVTILAVKGQAVRVGIEAPKNVNVLRTELAERMAVQGEDATVQAALEKFVRESEISSTSNNEEEVGRELNSAMGSLRCRAPRNEVAPVSSGFQSTGPASFVRSRRRRVSLK
jgi:carbon storage regulator